MSTTDDKPVINADEWTANASRYTDVIGNTTVHGTSRLVDALHTVHPFTSTSHAIDLGCGTGSLTRKIHEKCPETRILATDIATGMLSQVDALKFSNVTTKQVDGAMLEGLRDGDFSHGVSSFAISFIPEPRDAVRSLYRVVKPGGMVGIATWGAKIDWGQAIGTAAKRLKPDYTFHIPESASTWRTEAEHSAVLQAVGLRDIQTETVNMPLAVEDTQGVVDYAFRGGNPVMKKMIADWVGQGGSAEELEGMYAKVIVEDFPDGVSADAVLGWGVK
ncbi:hypothetical protein LTR86_008743 [Recurvomyces mirabilis]|nr:hypothetical protein LTR86_008743 [Recurvomyces mirabilis]